MAKDIFDRTDLSDLSVSTREALRNNLFPMKDRAKEILNLFNFRESLGMDDILIGINRSTGKSYSRILAYQQILRLLSKKYVVRDEEKRGYYHLTDKGREVLKLEASLARTDER